MFKIVLFLIASLLIIDVHADKPAVIELEEITPTGTEFGLQNFSGDGNSVYPKLIESKVYENEQAKWLSFVLTNYDLDGKGYLLIISKSDGYVQKLTQESLEIANGQTAAFQGGVVTFELYQGARFQSATYDIKKIVVGGRTQMQEIGDLGEQSIDKQMEFIQPLDTIEKTQESLCEHDHRVAEIDKRIGRLFPVGCTAFLIENGYLLTAGHCNTERMTSVHFNVPVSTTDGVIQVPSPDDQYLVDESSVVQGEDEDKYGDDWAIFKVFKNSNTNQYPIEKQESFFKISYTNNINNINKVKISGYGIDQTPRGSGSSNGFHNSSNQTLQKSAGSLLSRTELPSGSIYLSYLVDTESGNSGSPIIPLDTDGNELDFTIGIHTNGGCAPNRLKGNKGTSYLNSSFKKALKSYK